MAEINTVIAEASQDLQTIEDFVNLPAGSVVNPRLLPSVDVGTLAGIRDAIFENGGLPATPFATMALMTASALVDGDYAMVTEDTVNNGLYVKAAGAWVKSEYDPVGLSKSYTDEVSDIDNASSRMEIAKAVDFVTYGSSDDYLHQYSDKEGLIVASINAKAEFEAQDFKTPNGGLSSIAKLVQEKPIGDFTHLLTDVNGNIMLGISSDGSLVGGNTESSSSGLAEIRSGVLTDSEMVVASMKLDKKAINEDPINFGITVSESGQDGTLHQRMPSAIETLDGRLFVAYAQFSTAGTDTADGRLVGRFVEYDLVAGTSSVGATQEIDGTKTGSLSRHPNLLRLSDRIVMLFNDRTKVIQLESFDECATWVGRRDVSLPDFPAYLGLDAILRFNEGRYAGRVVLATYGGGVGLMYSDDNCQTWQKGARLRGSDVDVEEGLGFTEPSIALDASNNIVCLLRNNYDAVDYRYVMTAYSKDGGKTLVYDTMRTDLPTSRCQMAIAQMSADSFDGVPKIIVAHPTLKSFARTHYRVRVSYNNANSFISNYAPFPNDMHIGYSSIRPLSPSLFAILYEEGGINQATQSVKLKILNISEII